ncbi:Mlc titration factor MtfA, regulates ptsG expression [Gulbenkiania indica]|uniref:Mlc titration factor MtfA, regulates ptsG expression n=1 Tax=Gulbenkiania indica TaxID=375574 RepID=A0A0K6GVR3_9NEIS|nr:M90 family metallopeptidase [Gulbenkiania indica]CUA82837.1 Mlc titration factor MtfA, regulates ptsG expression [Gulbenkiania indica]
MFLDWFRKTPGHGTNDAVNRGLDSIASGMPILAGLSVPDRGTLVALAGWLIRNKAFVTADGTTLDDEALAVLALQLALPALHLGEAAFAGWEEVIVYPDAFRVRDVWLDDDGLMHEADRWLVGEARHDGPLILSLPDVLDSPRLDGWNVAIHELAHKLDQLDGEANGYPPLHRGMDRAAWHAAWSDAYEGFGRAPERGEEGWLDPYAGEHPAEFFAVLSEYFFEAPHWVRDDYPALYQQLAQFYRQDPAGRLARLPLEGLLPPPEAGSTARD